MAVDRAPQLADDDLMLGAPPRTVIAGNGSGGNLGDRPYVVDDGDGDRYSVVEDYGPAPRAHVDSGMARPRRAEVVPPEPADAMSIPDLAAVGQIVARDPSEWTQEDRNTLTQVRGRAGEAAHQYLDDLRQLGNNKADRSDIQSLLDARKRAEAKLAQLKIRQPEQVARRQAEAAVRQVIAKEMAAEEAAIEELYAPVIAVALDDAQQAAAKRHKQVALTRKRAEVDAKYPPAVRTRMENEKAADIRAELRVKNDAEFKRWANRLRDADRELVKHGFREAERTRAQQELHDRLEALAAAGYDRITGEKNGSGSHPDVVPAGGEIDATRSSVA